MGGRAAPWKLDLVRLRRTVAVALPGAHVDDDGGVLLQERRSQRAVEGDEVVTRHRTHVGHAQVLEEPPRLREVHHRVPDALGPLEHEGTEARDVRRQGIPASARIAPLRRELDAAQVLADGADRGRDAHLVVVEQDDHARLALADVVERLQRQPAHEGRITDDDGDVLGAAAPVARQRQALGDGQARARVAAVHDVVDRSPSGAGSRPMPPSWRSVPKLVQASRQQLVGVGLVAGVPDDPVGRAGEHAMQGHGELHDAQRAAQVTAGHRDGVDDVLADLRAERARLGVADVLEVLRSTEVAQRDHGLEVVAVVGAQVHEARCGRRCHRRAAGREPRPRRAAGRSAHAARRRARRGRWTPPAAGRPPRVAPRRRAAPRAPGRRGARSRRHRRSPSRWPAVRPVLRAPSCLSRAGVSHACHRDVQRAACQAHLEPVARPPGRRRPPTTRPSGVRTMA